MFEYSGVKQALKEWLVTRLPTWFADSQVFVYRPRLEEMSVVPAAIITSARAVPRTPSTVVIDYIIQIGLVTRGPDARRASAQLDELLKDFDNAWIAATPEVTKGLNLAYGEWVEATQLGPGFQTVFDPEWDDRHGIVTYMAVKTVRITERIRAYQI